MNTPASTIKKLSLATFAGVTALMLAAPAAEAAVIYTNLSASPLAVGNTIEGLYLNVVTGGSGSSADNVAGWDVNPYNNGLGLTFYGADSPGGVLSTAGTPAATSVATALSFGQLISSAGYYNTAQTQGTAFQVSGQEYLGFRFVNEATSAVNYGWLLLNTNAVGFGFPASILGYAYENTGLSITAGQVAAVPEPSTFAMFGLALAGAVGLRGWKNRRAAIIRG